MKKALLPLLLVVPLVACSPQGQLVNVIKAEATVSGHFSKEQIVYLTNEDSSNTSPYNGNMSVSKPVPVTISWDGSEGLYDVSFFEDEDLTKNIVSYSVEGQSFDFYNPIFNKDYYVKVTYVCDDSDAHNAETTSFKESPTVKGPRNLHIDGVENFRDIGGWGYIKQGMIYRSGRFNEDKEETVKASISKDGLYEVNNHLKIKTEIDLRRTSNNEVGGLTNKSVLGDNVKYYQLPMAYGGNNILTFNSKLSGDTYQYDNPAMIKNFFEILADENNYPINFHCSIGKDRTGCMAYLIEGLLGFDQETMYRDYMFTNFANAGMCKLTDITDRYGDTLDKYTNGETLQEKVYNYLNEVIGVSKNNLDKIINILKA